MASNVRSLSLSSHQAAGPTQNKPVVIAGRGTFFVVLLRPSPTLDTPHIGRVNVMDEPQCVGPARRQVGLQRCVNSRVVSYPFRRPSSSPLHICALFSLEFIPRSAHGGRRLQKRLARSNTSNLSKTTSVRSRPRSRISNPTSSSAGSSTAGLLLPPPPQTAKMQGWGSPYPPATSRPSPSRPRTTKGQARPGTPTSSGS